MGKSSTNFYFSRARSKSHSWAEAHENVKQFQDQFYDDRVSIYGT